MKALRRLAAAIAAVVLIAGALYAYGMYRDSRPQDDVRRALNLLHVERGATVADIGAGSGRMAVIAAEIVGPAGRVFATEIDEAKLREIGAAAASSGVSNLTTIRGAESATALPDACCDAILISKVYHHFEHPASMNRDIYRALRPGGRVAVIDFEPRWWRFWLSRPDGVPENRGGHGMPLDILHEELQQAGFKRDQVVPDFWRFPERRYCVVFRKPEVDEGRSPSMSGIGRGQSIVLRSASGTLGL